MNFEVSIVTTTILSLFLLAHQAVGSQRSSKSAVEEKEMKILDAIVREDWCKGLGRDSTNADLQKANEQCEQGFTNFQTMPTKYRTPCSSAQKPATCKPDIRRGATGSMCTLTVKRGFLCWSKEVYVPLEECAKKVIAYYDKKAEKELQKQRKRRGGAPPKQNQLTATPTVTPKGGRGVSKGNSGRTLDKMYPSEHALAANWDTRLGGPSLNLPAKSSGGGF